MTAPSLNWDRFVTAFLRRYDAMDRALVAAGFPATSPWWRAQIERAMRRGCRRWVIRAGRRAGKSSTLCRLAVCWALPGLWSVPPGDTAVIPFVSVDRDEAGARLRTIAEILRTLGAGFDQRSDEIELHDRRLVFRVATCSIKGAVGFTSVMVVADEQARWESRDTAANPAADVMGSLRPTGATQAHWFEVDVSSPWGLDDLHAQLFEAGDTDAQTTSFAPTWVANPTITEARTHELEPDPRVWSREYAAEPGATLTVALDPVDVLACFQRARVGRQLGGFVAIDASSLRGDDFTVIGGFTTDAGELVVCEVDGWESDQLRRVSMHEIVQKISERATAWNTRVVYADQREEAALSALFSEHHITLKSYAWSEPSKDEAVMLLRRMMREGKVVLCEHATMQRELLTMKARLMPSGRVRYESNGLDYASALITAAHAIADGQIMHVDMAMDLFVAASLGREVQQASAPDLFGREDVSGMPDEGAQQRFTSFGANSRGY